MGRRSRLGSSTGPGSLFTWRCISLAFMLAVRARGGGLYSSASPVDEVGTRACVHACETKERARAASE